MTLPIVASRLKRIRESRQITQKELAQRLGLHEQMVYRYENGLSEPMALNLAAMAKELNVSLDYLTGLSDDADELTEDRLSHEERQLIEAFRHGDTDAIILMFAEKLREHRAAQR